MRRLRGNAPNAPSRTEQALAAFKATGTPGARWVLRKGARVSEVEKYAYQEGLLNCPTPWRSKPGEGRQELQRLFKLCRDMRDLPAYAIMHWVHPCWAAVVDHVSRTAGREDRCALLGHFKRDLYRNRPTATQVLGYLQANKIPYSVVKLDSNGITYGHGGDHNPGVAMAVRAGALCDVMPYRCPRAGLRPARVAEEVVPPLDGFAELTRIDALAVFDVEPRRRCRKIPFDVVQGRQKNRRPKTPWVERAEKSLLHAAEKYAAELIVESLRVFEAHSTSRRLLMLRLRRGEALGRRYARLLTKERLAFEARMSLVAEEAAERSRLMADAESFPEAPRPALPDFSLAIGHSPPPVGEGGLGSCQRWYGFDTSEDCPGVIRSEDNTLDFLDLISPLWEGEPSNTLYELSEDILKGVKLCKGDHFYVRHAPALSHRVMCTGGANPCTVRAIRATLPGASHELLIQLLPLGIPVRVRGSFYTVFSWRPQAQTTWQGTVGVVFNPTVTGLVYAPPPVVWPRLRDIVGPNLDYKYRVLYTLYSQHVPQKCAGLLGLARSAEMGLEQRSGVEPADVAASLVAAETMLEVLSPGTAFEVS